VSSLIEGARKNLPEEILMLKIAIAAAAAALYVLPVSAAPLAAPTDLSAQPRIEVGPGGVRVGHDRWESRRRDRRIHDRFESRGDRRGGGCRSVTIRERLPGGGVRIVKRREC
jgi:hypothetical protein